MKTLALLAASLAVLSCSRTDVGIDGYTWYKAQEASTSYVWTKVSTEELAKACGDAKRTLLGCAIAIPGGTCFVYSFMSETDAKNYVPVGTTSTFEHEVWNSDKTIGHCAGYKHVEKYRATQV